jgi:hypothetical protein
MQATFLVHYQDSRSTEPCKSITIKTANINMWMRKFKHNNEPYISIIDYKLIKI